MSNTVNIKNSDEEGRMISVGGVTIMPGSTMPVPKWDQVKKSRAVQALIESGVIEEAGLPPENAGLPGATGGKQMSAEEAAELAEKDRIVGELQKHGIEKTNRTSLENLRKFLAEAEAEAAKRNNGGLPGAGAPATGGMPGA